MAKAQKSEDKLFPAWEADGSGAEALGAAYFEQGSFAEAVAFLKSARDISPENKLHLAESYINLGLIEDGLAVLDEMDAKALPRVNFLLGRAHLKAGDADQAVNFLTAISKDNLEALVELGMALEASGQTERAETLFAGVKIEQPDFIQTLIDKAGQFFGLGLNDLARDCLVRAERVARKDARIFYQLGIHYMDLNLAREAEAAFKKAIRWRPSLESYRELATVCEKSNQLDKAVAFSQAPQASGADDPYLNVVIAKCEFRKGNAEAALQRLLPYRDAFEEPDIKAEVLNILGRIYDKLGKVDEAYQAFEGSNQAMKETPDYCDLDLQYPYRNIATFNKMIAAGIPSLSEDKPTSARPGTHVFFMGFPRSGTTLVQTILESHKSVSVIEEKPALRAVINQLEKFATGYPNALSSLSEGAVDMLRETYFLKARSFTPFDENTTLVDKLPLNTLHLPLILTLFPNAKIIFAVRNPFASCFSCLMQNFSLNNAMGNLMGLDDITKFYTLVMGFWDQVSKTSNFDYHTVKYEDLIEDLEPRVRDLVKFLELDWDSALMDYAGTAKAKGMINTPSYHQVVQPVYKDSQEKWRAYEQFFAPYKERLKPFCDLFGYSG